MTHYIHHVPGRLRLRTLAVKRNEFQARRAKEHLEAIQGVTATDVNTLTGSIVIKYDVSVVASTTLMESLKGLGYLPAAHDGLATAASRAPSRKVGEELADKVVGKLMEKVLERSALALIAALI